ncbi:hypothetical protein [Aurantibacillus circumpalustris]|uniref:hypothetical protein n=1 Tax=Aurantibacillus circumpalustris TaxID=3036359 RepID=UPI00295C0D9C|nr:hypothetical protein [Aurantibacillus circumpalustris]
MKKIAVLLVSAVVMILFAQCNNPSAENMVQNPESRAKVISALLNDEECRTQLMDSLHANKHKRMGGKDGMMGMMMSDTSMHSMMMDKMMERCKSDTSMCRKMMGKTIDMCNVDSSTCAMMMDMGCCKKGMMKSMMHKMHKDTKKDKCCEAKK